MPLDWLKSSHSKLTDYNDAASFVRLLSVLL